MSDKLSDEILMFPVERLRIGEKVKHILFEKEAKTVKDFLAIGTFPLLRVKGFGSKKIQKIEDEVNKLRTLGAVAYIDRPLDAVHFIKNIFQVMKVNEVAVLSRRIGFGCKPMTFEEAGEELGMSRQGAQLLEKNAIAEIHENFPEAVYDIINETQTTLEKYSQFCALKDLLESRYIAPVEIDSKINPLTVGRLVMLLTDRNLRIYKERYITTMQDEQIKESMTIFDTCLKKNALPQPILKIFATVNLEIPDVSMPLFNHYIYDIKQAVTDKSGNVMRYKGLSIPDKIEIVMHEVNKGLHHKEILHLMLASEFKDDFTSVNEKHLHSRMEMDNRFLLINRGTFLLRKKFIVPNESVILDETRKILSEEGQPKDTKFILRKLHNRIVNLPAMLNKYSLSGILKTSPGFTSNGKLVVGLDEFGEVNQEQLYDIIFKILDSASSPLHTSEIFSKLREVRGHDKIVLLKTLGDTPTFLRFNQGVYGLRKHIPFDDDTISIIQTLCREKLKSISEFTSFYSILHYISFSSSKRDLEKKLSKNLLAILSLSDDFIIKGFKVKLRDLHESFS